MTLNYSLLLIPLTGLLVTYFLLPYWIKTAKKLGLTGKDMNKHSHPVIPEMGGITVITGFITAVLFFLFLDAFYFHVASLEAFLAVLLTLALIGFIGVLDTLLGWKKGLKQWQKPMLTLLASTPLILSLLDHSTLFIPFIGVVDVGLLYPLVLIPLGVMGASNAVNMLAGFNGLEAGLGVIILTTLGVLAAPQNYLVALLAFTGAACLLAFLKFNWFPAKVFPGDALTYFTGGLIAVVAIVGGLEFAGLVLFAPYFLELYLKAKSRFKAETFGKPLKTGKIKSSYGEKIYSIPHFFTRTGKFTESQVIIKILAMQALLSVAVLIFYFTLV